jgi:aspartate aminotransferase
MPRRNTVYDDVGRGFAAFLAPPPPDVIRFTVGQPDFETPAKAVEAAVAGLRSGAHGYTRSQGSESLCEAVANHLRGYGIGAAPADIVVTPGCKQAVLYALMTTLAPGDEVVLLSPAWPSYDGMVRIAGGVPVHVPVRRDNYHPDLDAIRAAITSRTKAILLNSPNNPTGAVYTPTEVQAIVEMAVTSDLWILDDMIYAPLVYGEHLYTSPATLPGGAERTVTIGGWSKGWAMTGWRLGWITAPSELMAAVKTLQTSAATHVPTFLMPAAELALGLEDEVRAMRESFDARRVQMHAGLQTVPGLITPLPEGAFYALVDVTGTGMDDVTFTKRALEEARVAVIPGSLMQWGEGLIRMSYATAAPEIDEGLRRMRIWLEG